MPTAKAHHELPLLEPIKHYIYFRLHYSVSISSRRDGGIAFMICLPVWHTRWTHTDAGASAAQSHKQHFTTEDTCNLNIRIFNERQQVKTEAQSVELQHIMYRHSTDLLCIHMKSLVLQSGSWLMLPFLHKDSVHLLSPCVSLLSPLLSFCPPSAFCLYLWLIFFLFLFLWKPLWYIFFSSPASSLIPLFLFLACFLHLLFD